MGSRSLGRKFWRGAFWLLAILAGVSSASAQSSAPLSEWTRLNAIPADKISSPRWVQAGREQLFRLDRSVARANLARAVLAEPAEAGRKGVAVELPLPDGTTAWFLVVAAPVMAPELAAKFPELKTYAGQGIDDPDATVRLDLTPAGLHAQVLSPRGAVYVDPAFPGDADHHVSYFKRDYRKQFDDFRCFTEGSGVGTVSKPAVSSSEVAAAKVQSGSTLRTYRLAVAATGEFTAYYGGTVAAGLAAIVTAVNRVDGVFETELAVRMVLVGNNNLLVYTNSATDPYSNSDGNAMLSQNQSNLDAVIGRANYDLGHVFSTEGGGIASLGSVCVPTQKARGVTGHPVPTGDSFWIDYVAHELGHQFGADHTFNSTNDNCGAAARVPSQAFEPGSGSTIMAYAGICSPDNLQAHSDPYFHAGSLDQIQAFIASGGGGACATLSSTGNNPPTISAGAAYAIPQATPFVLTATASDSNGDPLTYCWEERDLGPASALTNSDNGSSPLLRSFMPTNNPVRYFPKLSSVLANTNWNQEKLPTTSRTLNFRVTARDNRPGGGGVADADTTVTVVSNAGPFVVTSPNTAVTWSNTHTVTWTVAATTNVPISASGVNIYLSLDGGQTFPCLLATNTPNDGSQSVTLPGLASSAARIRVQAAGNIFYDVSDVNFTLLRNGPYLLLASTALLSESCLPANAAIDPFETVTVNWAITNAGNAPTTNLVARLLATNGVFYPSLAQNYGVVPAGGSATRAFSFVPAGICGGSVTGCVQLTDGAANLGALVQPFALGARTGIITTQIFNNASAIIIRDATNASPYPSLIPVAGVSNSVVNVTVSLTGLSHTYPDDIGIVLVGPDGQSVALLDSCGGATGVVGVNLILDDNAADSLPDSSPITSGVYRPTNFGPARSYPSPAPALPYGSSLGPLGLSPNGTWSLYVADFSAQDAGSLSQGWKITLLASNSVAACCTTFPAPTLTSTTYSNAFVSFYWSALPGPNYQVQFRTNLGLGLWQDLGSPLPGTNAIMGISDDTSNAPMRFYRVLVTP